MQVSFFYAVIVFRIERLVLSGTFFPPLLHAADPGYSLREAYKNLCQDIAKDVFVVGSSSNRKHTSTTTTCSTTASSN